LKIHEIFHPTLSRTSPQWATKWCESAQPDLFKTCYAPWPVITEQLAQDGRPYALAPAYDMLPMGFAPLSGGGLRDKLTGGQPVCQRQERGVRLRRFTAVRHFLNANLKSYTISQDYLKEQVLWNSISVQTIHRFLVDTMHQ
jgi:hypothetical protein